jgi:hypothetical protein
MSGADGPCDLVLLFATSRHDFSAFGEAVSDVAGRGALMVGGGAIGTITNDRFGYAGDQTGVACLWLEDAEAEVISEGGLEMGEFENGRRLGQKLLGAGAGPNTQMLLFYDAIFRDRQNFRLMMATNLLAGLESGMGYLPDIRGVGMQGDYACSSSMQWTGRELDSHCSTALIFGGGARVDSAIMHGCHPATGYYTVTKADGPMILEINGRPALGFVRDVLGGMLEPEEFPFFLLFGVSQADKWGEFDEDNCASRLCLAIDHERQGIVMFEPDMTEGAEFQIMYRSLELDYMRPKIDGLFASIEGRKPVLAFYINCAGRAAGYGGIDMEDAVAVQEAARGRAPLLGVYSGVEIARIMGRPRGLDWTGVFCLISEPA